MLWYYRITEWLYTPAAVFRSSEKHGVLHILRGGRVPDAVLVRKIIIDEGMIFVMKKRLMCLAVIAALTASMFTAVNAFAASSDTSVIVSDGFEDREVGGVVNTNGSSENAMQLYAVNGTATVCEETGGNKYLTTESAKYVKFYADRLYSKSDRLAISMDIMNPAALTAYTSDSTVGANLYIDNTPVLLLNMNEKSAAQGLEVKYYYNDGTSNKQDNMYTAPGSTTKLYTNQRQSGIWNHFEAVFKRELVDGDYTVALEKLKVNGKALSVDDSVFQYTPNFKSVDWWTGKTSRANFVSIGNITKSWAIDNVMIYAPSAGDMTTNVKVPSYAPSVGTVVLDDDFDSSVLSGSTMTTAYEKGCTSVTSIDSLSTDIGGNKYPITKAWAKFASKTAAVTDSDRLVVSLKIKAPASLTTGTKYYAGFNCSATTCCPLIFYYSLATESDNVEDYADKYKVQLVTRGIDSSNTNGYAEKYLTKEPIFALKSDFTKFTIVMDKKLNSDGETYGAYVTGLYLNDEDIGVWDTPASYPLYSNWWEVNPADTATGTKNSFWMGNHGTAGWAVDDLLVYAPAAFGVSGISLSADGTSADITFSDTVGDITNASVTVSTVDGTQVGASLSKSGKVLNAAFVAAPDLARNVYTITVSGVKDIGGASAADYTMVIGTGFASIDKANGTAVINNESSNVLSGKLIIAGYDGEANLVNAVVSTSDINTKVDLTQSVTYTLPTGDGIEYYKFFAWNDTDELTPLFANAVIR